MWPQALGIAMQVAGSLFHGQNPATEMLGHVLGGPAQNFQHQALSAVASAVAREAWTHFPTSWVAKIVSRELAVHTLAKMNLHDFIGYGLSEHEMFLEVVHFDLIAFTCQQDSDFYGFLGVERTATHVDIMRAYGKVSAEIRANGSPQQVNGHLGLTKIDLVTIVADTLANQTTRAQYDKVLKRLEGTQFRDLVFWAGTAFNLWMW